MANPYKSNNQGNSIARLKSTVALPAPSKSIYRFLGASACKGTTGSHGNCVDYVKYLFDQKIKHHCRGHVAGQWPQAQPSAQLRTLWDDVQRHAKQAWKLSSTSSGSTRITTRLSGSSLPLGRRHIAVVEQTHDAARLHAERRIARLHSSLAKFRERLDFETGSAMRSRFGSYAHFFSSRRPTAARLTTRRRRARASEAIAS